MSTSLEQELQSAEQAISTDSYSMSIGELISSYKGGEIELNPQFQRFFRWEPPQKSRLIESFLLGLPVPPIFVFQKPSGQWELIDGLQRVSTILEFAGELKDKEDKLVPTLKLTRTKYLPSLEGITWKDGNPEKTLSDSLKLKFRKSRLDVKIVLSKSAEFSKYELFDRLNTGGTQATPAEVRNCMVIMKDSSFFTWMDQLVTYPSFVNCIPLTERAEAEQYRFELLVRFLLLQRAGFDDAKSIDDLETYLNEKILDLASDEKYDRQEEAEKFKKTFDILWQTDGENIFRRHRSDTNQPTGPFLLAAFEVIALGVSKNLAHVIKNGDQWLKDRVRKLWEEELIRSIGMRASQRLSQTIPLAINHFQ